MSLIVQKFGGSSVRDKERLYRAAQRAVDTYQKGNQVVVVVSAQGNTTDSLIKKAQEIGDTPPGREMDVLLSTGEQISMALMAMAISALGCPAVSLTGWQAGIKTCETHQNARIRHIDTTRIREELAKGNIVVVAGFQGIDEQENITTLGRGGSDSTAVALAEALLADRCQIFTDVEGIYTADPQVVEEAVKLTSISYDEMLKLASMGAKVLHDRSVAMAKRGNVVLEVLSSITESEGTVVQENSNSAAPHLQGVTADRTVVRYCIKGLNRESGGLYTFIEELAQAGIRPDLLGQNEEGEIFFTAAHSKREEINRILKKRRLHIKEEDIWAKITAVGQQLTAFPKLKKEFFEVLHEAEIPWEDSWMEEDRFSVLVLRERANDAVHALHQVVLRHHLK